MPDDDSVLAGTVWMIVLSVLLFWIPVLGPLAAGFVGGRKAGSTGRAFLAALLPALVVGLLVFFLVNALPDVGGWIAALFAAAVFFWIVVQMGLVVVGALLGGATADGRVTRHATI